MNKTVIIGAILVLAAAGGYYQFSVVPAQEAAEQATIAEAAKKAADAAAAKAAEVEAAAKKAAEDEAAAKAAEIEAAARKAAEDAAAAAKAAADDAAAAAQDTMAALSAALDPASFDATRLGGLLDAAPIDESTRMTLKTLVEAAGANPALVQTALGQIKSALGL